MCHFPSFFCALHVHIFCATLDRHHLHLLLCEAMCCARDFARRLLQTGWHHSKSSRPPLRTTKTKIGGWMEEPPFRLLPSVVWIVGIRELGLIFQTKDSKQQHHSSSDSQDTRAQLISPSSSPPFTSRDKKVAKVATFCKLNTWPDGHSERNLCFFSAKLTSKFPIKSNSSKLNQQWGNVCVGGSIQAVRQWGQKGSVVVLPLLQFELQ